MYDISQQIKERVVFVIKEQLDKIVPLYGAFRRFEDLRLNLKQLFPQEVKLNKEESAIKFITDFVKEDVRIIKDFEDRKTKHRLTVYTLQKSKTEEKTPVRHASQQPAAAVTETKPEEVKRAELRQFAFFLDFDGMLEAIAKMAKPEVWRFGSDANASAGNKYPILKAYLYQVFSRLKYESEVLGLANKIVIVACESTDREGNKMQTQKCAINTGLISKGNGHIYMLFDKNNRNGGQEWFYKLASDDIYSQNFLPFRDNLPMAADFYDSLSHSTVIYRKEVAAINTDHILSDHCERLPIRFLKQYFGSYHKFQDGSDTPLKTPKDWTDFKKYIKEDAQRYEYEDACNKLHRSIIEAQRKAQSGDAFRVLIYRPEQHAVGFFLPLYLVKPKDETDFEVGVIVDNSTQVYVARTIYQTSMAYDKIRVMGSQARSWLDPLKIKHWQNPYASETLNNNLNK